MSKKKNKVIGVNQAIVDLISRGAKIDSQIKKKKMELDKIKKDLRTLGPGSYSTNDGSSVTISASDAFTDPDPKTVYKWFKKNMTIKAFLKVIKVQVTAAKTIMGEVAFEETRELKDKPVIRMAFKKMKDVELEAKEVEETMGAGKTRILKFKD